MSEGNDDLDLDEPQDDEPAGGDPEGGKPEGDEPAGDEPKLDPKVQKRISDLQSRADSEAARANKLEKALADAGKGKDGAGDDPATKALMSELREASLDAVYGEFPELKKYGIERALIEGSSRAEMRESATAIVAMLKNVSTKVRNEVLAEHGLEAKVTGSTRTAPVDYASMDDEKFLKLLDSI